MKILVLGLGVNGGGFSAARYLSQKHCVRVSDIAKESSFGKFPNLLRNMGVECFFEDIDPKDNIKWADIVIKNPAIPSNLPQLSLAKEIKNDFSFLFSSPLIKEVKLILVTGTKGKTTTVAALTHALNNLGHETIYCGNIGVSGFLILEELERRDKEKLKLPQYIICELSSWQIHDTNIALNGLNVENELTILTSLYNDHQNTYNSVYQYYDDKMLLLNEKCKSILVHQETKSYVKAHALRINKKINTFPKANNPYQSEKKELSCAYYALKLLGFKKKTISSALSSYKGMPHRIEHVASKNNIMYINDSAATIAEAVTFSTLTLAPLSYHLICGGTDKALPANGMLDGVTNATTITLLSGSFTEKKLIPMLEKNNLKYSGPFSSMEEAFKCANSLAIEKRDETDSFQVVILSPGASSFELFKNEFFRGDAFKDEVNKIINK